MTSAMLGEERQSSEPNYSFCFRPGPERATEKSSDEEVGLWAVGQPGQRGWDCVVLGILQKCGKGLDLCEDRDWKELEDEERAWSI